MQNRMRAWIESDDQVRAGSFGGEEDRGTDRTCAAGDQLSQAQAQFNFWNQEPNVFTIV